MTGPIVPIVPVIVLWSSEKMNRAIREMIVDLRTHTEGPFPQPHGIVVGIYAGKIVLRIVEFGEHYTFRVLTDVVSHVAELLRDGGWISHGRRHIAGPRYEDESTILVVWEMLL